MPGSALRGASCWPALHRRTGKLEKHEGAGVLARFGFNSVGISITGNYPECERDYRTLGVPLALIRRKVLEQTASNNIIVAHAAGVAIDFE